MAERYRIKGRLGRGGMGAVYLAYDHHLGRDVAIKRLLPIEETNLNEAAEETLESEARALASLSHPNIVSLFEVGRDDKGPFVVFEHIEGNTLKSVVNEGALSENDLYEVADRILDALVAAQQIDILHRDIKPANIMLSWLPSGKFQIKILDFGLSKFSHNPSKQTLDQKGSFLGSIDYVAPEQIRMLPLDQRTDLYSLGCVLYYALTQRPPFSGDSMAETMNNHLEGKVVPLEQLRPDLPAAICQWVMRLISERPEDRPDDAMMALRELEEARRRVHEVPEKPDQTVKLVVPVLENAQLCHQPGQLEHTQQIISVPLAIENPVPVPPNAMAVEGQRELRHPLSRSLKDHVTGSVETGSGEETSSSFTTLLSRQMRSRIPIWLVLSVVGMAALGFFGIKSVLNRPHAESNPGGAGKNGNHQEYANSDRPGSLPELPRENKLVACYSIGGGLFLDRKGVPLDWAGDSKVVLGALENVAPLAHSFHLLKSPDDVSRVPVLGENANHQPTLFFKPGDKLMTPQRSFSAKLVQSPQFTISFLYRIPEEMSGTLLRVDLVDANRNAHPRALKFSFGGQSFQLQSDSSDEQASSQSVVGEYLVTIIEFDGDEQEVTMWHRQRGDPHLPLTGGVSIGLSMPTPVILAHYEIGSLIIQKNEMPSQKLEVGALAIHKARLTDAEKRRLAQSLFDGAYPQAIEPK